MAVDLESVSLPSESKKHKKRKLQKESEETYSFQTDCNAAISKKKHRNIINSYEDSCSLPTTQNKKKKNVSVNNTIIEKSTDKSNPNKNESNVTEDIHKSGKRENECPDKNDAKKKKRRGRKHIKDLVNGSAGNSEESPKKNKRTAVSDNSVIDPKDLIVNHLKKKKKRKDEEHNISSDTTPMLPTETIATRKSVSFDKSVVNNEKQIKRSKLKEMKQKQLQQEGENKNDGKELMLTESSENKKPTISKRQKKREKFEKLETEEKLKSEQLMIERALSYLSLWKHNKAEWKFEKVRQVWILHNMYDVEKLPERNWETLVEYFTSSKGLVRKTLVESAMKIIQNMEGWIEKSEKSKIENEEFDDSKPCSIKYQRARHILQSLQE